MARVWHISHYLRNMLFINRAFWQSPSSCSRPFTWHKGNEHRSTLLVKLSYSISKECLLISGRFRVRHFFDLVLYMKIIRIIPSVHGTRAETGRTKAKRNVFSAYNSSQWSFAVAIVTQSREHRTVFESINVIIVENNEMEKFNRPWKRREPYGCHGVHSLM